ncbi:hypothetical protein [Lichenifustis flavocetrariae]|uniref:Uncharacterized protein n=1 Tax=Lichenifustis flavocetrariae TaxID=2949735 RepID=A0AA41YTW7_9HYPH|nr:hypothetical protein [Lichenifustis flavocetrariae]MCW6506763.1 hypothetical protein [Lichenifustis flavocetrariae]
MRRLGFAICVSLVVGGTALAQDDDPREQVIDLATIEVAHDLCKFDLSEAQEDAIGKRRQALVDDGSVTAADIASVQDEIGTSMRRQMAEGLCKPDGPEAKLYRKLLAILDPS